MATWGKPCELDNRITIRLFGAAKVWHRAGVGYVKYAELLAMRTRYGRFLAKRLANGHLLDVQTYSCRTVRGGSDWSMHAWPRAVDIRPEENPMSDSGVLRTDFDLFGLVDGVRWLMAWSLAGFKWGAIWARISGPIEARHLLKENGRTIRDGRVDPMHFEIEDPEPKSRSYWVKRVRRFARRHPIYMRKVFKAARVRTARELVEKWYAGEA